VDDALADLLDGGAHAISLDRAGEDRPGDDLTSSAAASGEPTATAVAPGTARRTSLESTSPGPASTNASMPDSASARIERSHRTGETMCRESRSRNADASRVTRPLTLGASAIRGRWNVACDRA